MCLQKPDARYNIQLAKRLHGLEHHKMIWVKPTDIKASHLPIMWGSAPCWTCPCRYCKCFSGSPFGGQLLPAAQLHGPAWTVSLTALQLLQCKLLLQLFTCIP